MVSDALITRIPSGVVSVAESGLQRASDLVQLREAGYDAFLIGESLITSSDPGRHAACPAGRGVNRRRPGRARSIIGRLSLRRARWRVWCR